VAIPMAMPLFTFICPRGHPSPPSRSLLPLLASAWKYGNECCVCPRSWIYPTPFPSFSSRIELKPPPPALFSFNIVFPSFLHPEVFDSRPVRVGTVISISRVGEGAREGFGPSRPMRFLLNSQKIGEVHGRQVWRTCQ
jgi:hypothetical protein